MMTDVDPALWNEVADALDELAGQIPHYELQTDAMRPLIASQYMIASRLPDVPMRDAIFAVQFWPWSGAIPILHALATQLRCDALAQSSTTDDYWTRAGVLVARSAHHATGE